MNDHSTQYGISDQLVELIHSIINFFFMIISDITESKQLDEVMHEYGLFINVLVLFAILFLIRHLINSLPTLLNFILKFCYALVKLLIKITFRYIIKPIIKVNFIQTLNIIGGFIMISILGHHVVPKGKFGIVRKKMGAKSSNIIPDLYLPEILQSGTHYGYSSLFYEIEHSNPIEIEAGEIGLVIANQGEEIDNNEPIKIGKVVACNKFQDAEQFLRNGGQKGEQLQILTAGRYFIHPKLFTVITKTDNKIQEKNLKPESLKSYIVKEREIGIVTVLTGEPNNDDDNINSVDKNLHNSYQDPQAFFAHGGKQGLQEEILTPGKYYINPWFAKIQAASITEIPTGAVGVVTSHTGKESNEKIVDEGYKGVWKKIIRGKKNINTETKTVHLIPTMDITLEWSPKEEKLPNSYDRDLPLLKLSTKNGFEITLEVSQTIKIKEEDAPKLISRLHSIKQPDEQISKDKLKYPAISSLITRVIKSSVQSYFTNIAQQYEAEDFKTKKDEIQKEALKEVQFQLDEYGVEAKRLTISIESFPEDLNQELQYETILKKKIKTAQLEHQKQFDDAKAKNARAEIEAETKLAEEKHLIKIYGKDQYFEMKKIESLIQIKFPNTVYGNNILLDVIANNFQPHQAITEDNIKQTIQKVSKYLEEGGLGVNISKTLNNNDIDNKEKTHE